MPAQQEGHPLTLAHTSALTVLHSMIELNIVLRRNPADVSQSQKDKWMRAAICSFAECLPGTSIPDSVQLCLGNGEPVAFLGEVGASAHEAVFKAAAEILRRIERVLCHEYEKAHPNDEGSIEYEPGRNAFSTRAMARWRGTTAASLRKKINLDLRGYRLFREKLKAEYHSARRFLGGKGPRAQGPRAQGPRRPELAAFIVDRKDNGGQTFGEIARALNHHENEAWRMNESGKPWTYAAVKTAFHRATDGNTR